MNISYILPLKWQHQGKAEDMTAYLDEISRVAEVLVIDGSPEKIFADHRQQWSRLCRHLRPHSDLQFLNGKVNGVLTGLREARSEQVIIADDDVRFNPDNLQSLAGLLDFAELVLPQNYFDPLPWHAKWDTARTLLNRAVCHDYPGTLAVRRSFILGIGGYCGDVLFENLELIRTVKAVGGTVAHVPDLFVRRLPPVASKFLSQRVRQAYDDLAQPWRLALFLPLVPAGLTAKPRPARMAAAAAASVALAEIGRRRYSGRQVFPPASSLFAPLWVLERATCAWAALGQRLLLGGCRYGDVVIPRAATPLMELRRRLAGRDVAVGARPKADTLV